MEKPQTQVITWQCRLSVGFSYSRLDRVMGDPIRCPALHSQVCQLTWLWCLHNADLQGFPYNMRSAQSRAGWLILDAYDHVRPSEDFTEAPCQGPGLCLALPFLNHKPTKEFVNSITHFFFSAYWDSISPHLVSLLPSFLNASNTILLQ